jgi:hypothetical protein
LRENSALSPVGTSESSPGRSPGFGINHQVVPKGRLKPRLRCSAVPRGTVHLAYHYPGLSSWATFRRPYGTKLDSILARTMKAVPFNALCRRRTYVTNRDRDSTGFRLLKNILDVMLDR